MTNTQSIPKRHHYIPRKFLALFSFGKKDSIFFLDKNLSTIKPSSALKSARIHKFYNYPNNQKESLETSFFASIDANGISAIKQIIKDKSTINITPRQKNSIIEFVAAQMCRVPARKKHIESIIDTFLDVYGEKVKYTPKIITTLFLDQIKANTKNHIEFLQNKTMVIFEAPQTHQFIIGDNPVVTERGLRFNAVIDTLAPAVNYDAVALPISPKFALVFFDRTKNPNVKYIIKKLNYTQIMQAYNFIYANKESTLINDLRNYHECTFDFIKYNKPELLEISRIKRGDPVIIEPLKIDFTDELKAHLHSQASDIIDLDLILSNGFNLTL